MQHCAQLRFASWAVTRATELGVHCYDGTALIDSGPLPGLLQSAIRAEVFAVMRALQSAGTHVGPLHLWSDCAAVVRKLRKLIAGHSVRANSTHADLWGEIERLVRHRTGQISITRVAAHQTLQGNETFFEEWCFRNNAFADKCAVSGQ